MPESKTKLARALSADELESFCRRLAAEKNLTGARIQELAAEQGIEIGHTAAAVFRNREFEPWLERMRSRSQLAQYVAEHSKPEDVTTLADASAGELSQRLFEFMAGSEADINLNTPEGRKAANNLSLIIARIRQGDHRLRYLEQKLEAMQAAQKQAVGALDDPAVKKGMSAEAEKIIRDAFNFRPQEVKAA